MTMADQIDLGPILNGYVKEVRDGLTKSKKEVANDAAEKLRSSSPKKTGKYAADWGVKQVGSKQVVYNKKHYQLTHLLENSHALRNGGRSKAQVHIKPVEEEVKRKMVDRAKEVIIDAK